MNLTQVHAAEVKQKARSLGFHRVGIADVVSMQDGLESERLRHWLDLGHEASMAWMGDKRRQDITQVMPEVRSIICVALNYYTTVERSPQVGLAKLSRYGWGRDYHKVLTRLLKALVAWLEVEFEGVTARYSVDTGPIQEKAWAQAAGIGWIGKHANVITRDYGSWMFLGEVLTDLELAPDQPHTQHCGTCTRCLDACPTQAIVEPFVVDANRCIAYHTIENRGEEIPEAIAQNMQGWVAGCDICQDVCPWNERFAQPTTIQAFEPYAWNVNPSLEELVILSDEEWDVRFRASAFRRIKPSMLRRNAQANLGQHRATQTKSADEEIRRFADEDRHFHD